MQLQFFEERKVLLYNASHKPEGRGDNDNVNALDLGFRLDTHREELIQVVKNPDEFQRSFWDNKERLIQEITELKFSSPKTEQQRLSVRSHKYNKPVVFAPCTVTIKQGEPQEGAILRITFSVRVYPSVKQIGTMCDTVTSSPECQITLQDYQSRVIPGEEDQPLQVEF